MLLTSLPVIAFDETGNSGQNLLDPEQPVFALASVHLPESRAFELVREVIPKGATEAKFSSLRTSKRGRNRILALLREGAFSTSEVKIAIYHKSFMVTTKIVDMLVETWHNRAGIDLHENAGHLALANLLHSVIPVFCGEGAFQEWQRRFVALVRNKTPEHVDAFFEQTHHLRAANIDPEFDSALGMLALTRAVVDEGIAADDPVALDPAIPSLVSLAAQWTATLKQPFDLVHDHSKPVAHGRDSLRGLLRVDRPPQTFGRGDFEAAFPILAHDIRFADSRAVPQLQLADLCAGAAATLMRARARRLDDPFARQLLRAGIAELVTSPVWPDIAVSPQELQADERGGSRQLDFMVDLLGRKRPRRD